MYDPGDLALPDFEISTLYSPTTETSIKYNAKMIGERKAASTIAHPRKRRKPTSAIEEIAFDFNAREDYLTGFHKRKLQRIKYAKEEATKKEREERITARKIVRLLLELIRGMANDCRYAMDGNRIWRNMWRR